MVEKKVVSINPDFFKIASSNTTRKKRPTSDTPRPALKVKTPTPQKEKTSKTIKKNLLNYIRQQQQKNYDELTKPKHTLPTNTNQVSHTHSREPVTNNNSDFKDSLDYLMKLTKENEKKQHQNRTIRNPLHTPIQHTDQNVSMTLPLEFISPPPSNSPPIHINPPRPPISPPLPQYGCMKNGSLPTYRNWKNQTQKNYGAVSSPMPTPYSASSSGFSKISSNSTIGGSHQETSKEKLFREKVEELKRRSAINPIASSPQYSNQGILGGSGSQSSQIKAKIAQINYGKKLEQSKKENKKRVPKRQKTLRRTYRVGKSRIAPKVSVLVSNKTIRKNIYTQALLLKQTPIKEVKRYLIKHGFIRVGSIAPNDVLRRMYENARLVCGELKNHNPDNLLYNFLHGEGEEK